ncbi:Detected protein of unknown function [Hibiscus syriacus]|uniref:DUF4408 domain-containing protein n=1 Tax=Hibiscus syriacus TaxID=106335 RepID=A0A6A2YKH0_HIBSY|nr:pathogen-associated molecular patterns-induced protein A70-like [Hibiscus syriacus]KAE8678747.1 Detected protein of unknown function [Hibiscus syriacus]
MVFSVISALTASWLSPTALFIFLNIVIATIFLISRLSPYKTQNVVVDDYNSSRPSLHRPPSFLDRVKSFNFSNCRFPLSNTEFDHHLHSNDGSAAHRPSILERVKSFYKYSPQGPEMDYIQPAQQELSRPPSLSDRVKSFDFTSFYKSDSIKSNQMKPSVTEEIPVHGEVERVQAELKVRRRENLPEKMKKSTREKERRKVEEEEIIRRTASTGNEKTTAFEEDDHGVDAKADDFINKFKQQLKMQRLESLLRYRDVLKAK